MHKRLLSLFLMGSTYLFSAPTGNAAWPDIIKRGIFTSEDMVVNVNSGFEYDIMWDQKLRTYAGASGLLNTFAYKAGLGVLSVDLYDRVEIYGKVGFMSGYFDQNPYVSSQSISEVQNIFRTYQTERNLIWSVGARVLLFEIKDFFFTGQASMLRSNFDILWNIRDDDLSFTTLSEGKGVLKQWQTGLLLGRKIEFLYPYLGVKYSATTGEVYNLPYQMDIGSFKFKSRNHCGMVVGLGISTGKYYKANLEISMLDEDAVTIDMEITF